MTKILLDTDIGSDCDDAVCLAYLLLREDCELVGVTTVGPRAGLRAEIARKLCRHFGQPAVPVVAGASWPTLPNRYWWGHHVNQDGILDQPADAADPAPFEAVRFMRETIHRHPGEVVLLTVGPVTNAGLLAATDPEAFGKLKGLYTMGGRFQAEGESPRGECNAMLDPAAFAALLTTPTPHVFIAGVEATGPTRLTPDQVERIFAGEPLAIIRDCIRACAVGFGKDVERAGTGMHDPFTAACIFHSEFRHTRRGLATVRFQHHDFSGRLPFEPDQVTGYTLFNEDPEGPHRIAADVDIDAYHEHVDAVFSRARQLDLQGESTSATKRQP